MFGVCMDHQSKAVTKYFVRLVQSGACSYERPPCFDSHEQWKEYAVANVLSRGFAAAFDPKTKLDYCQDCTRSFKKRMTDENRCSHPETVFVHLGGENVVGVSIQEDRRSGYWEKCMMGVEGEVVGMPPAEIIDQVLTRLAKRRAGGRPRKDQTE